MKPQLLLLFIAAVVVPSFLGPAATHADLILHWKFDETDGITAYDTSNSPNTHNGTLYSPANWSSPGMAGGAVATNSTSSTSAGYVELPHHTDLAFGSNDFSVSLWVRKLEASAGWRNIWGVNKWRVGGNGEWTLSIGGQDDDLPGFSIQNSSGTSYSVKSDTPLTLGENAQWHHLVGVREGTNLRLYLDDELVAQRDDVPDGMAVRNLNFPLRMGLNNHLGGTVYPVKAVFDDLQITNRALTAGHVAWMYNNPGLPIPEPTSGLLLLCGAGAYVLLVPGRRRQRAAG